MIRIQVEFGTKELVLTRIDDKGVKITTSLTFDTSRVLTDQEVFGKFDIFLEEHKVHHPLWESALLVPDNNDVQYCYFSPKSNQQWVLYKSRLTDGVTDKQEVCG